MSARRIDLTALWSAHAVKFLRYSGVSAVNVALGLLLFNVLRVAFHMSWLMSNVLSVALGAVPAYFMSRAWVWQRDGKISMATEVLPFWGINFVGFVFSSVSVALFERWTESSLVLNVARLAAWAIVWVFKYLVLDRLLFTPAPAVEPDPVAVAR